LFSDRGHHPIAGHGAFTDRLGFAVLTAAGSHQRAAAGHSPVTM